MRRIRLIKKILLILIAIIAVTLVGCSDCNRDGSCNRSGNNPLPIYTCTGGIARDGRPEGTMDEENCAFCYGTHYRTSDNACIQRVASGERCDTTSQCEIRNLCEGSICRVTRYTCNSGTARNGSPNGNADVAYCASCLSSHILVGPQCIVGSNVVSVTPGSSIAASISVAGENDYYSVDLTVDSILIAYTEGSTDTYGYLYESVGNLLAIHDDISIIDTNFILSRPLEMGSYYIRVRNFYSSRTGDYRLRVYRVAID